ncbi:MAG: flippase, partial [Gemmatimonadetes bacterium]|nr:flippase [Gemmatimonadota bacterium]NIR79157.1 flippase [Gemmatimonadota bacterium]NIT87812.1 flippase [Gemmatimonadota bacterium]NIU31673.1 flippase [Gemmatimonadota bacterium]NIU36293.1 flippase [Gemmatimonadota bacterium]
GILEASQRFGLLNAVLIPMGALLFLAPLAVLPFSTSLVPVVGSLAAVRLAAWVVFLATTLRRLP